MNRPRQTHKHRWILTAVLVPLTCAALLFVGTLIAAYKPDLPWLTPITSDHSNKTAQAPEQQPYSRSEKWHGYYLDKATGGETLHSELAVEFGYRTTEQSGIEELDATTSGPVETSQGNVTRSWKGRGFRSGDYVAYTYGSTTKNSLGVGGCLLRRVEDRYEGFWYGRDTEARTIVGGPILLSEHELTWDQVKALSPDMSTNVRVLGDIPSL